MAKLKCWRKDLDSRTRLSYNHAYTYRSVRIPKEKKSGFFQVKIEGRELPARFKTVKGARKYAMNYMKENDDC